MDGGLMSQHEITAVFGFKSSSEKLNLKVSRLCWKDEDTAAGRRSKEILGSAAMIKQS